MVFNVLYDGVVDCSNTLEDEDEVELPPQAILYLSVRERIYGLLLPAQPGELPLHKKCFFCCLSVIVKSAVISRAKKMVTLNIKVTNS